MDNIFEARNLYLENALHQINLRDNSASRTAFYGALQKSYLLLPKEMTPDELLYDNSGISVRTTQNRDGSTTMTAFTHPKAMASSSFAQWPSVVIGGNDLAAVALALKASLVVFNPNGPRPGGFLTKTELMMMLEKFPSQGLGLSMPQNNEEASLQIEPLQEPPSQKLLTYLQLYLQREPDVKAAYLFEGAFENQPLHLVLGVEPSNEEPGLEKRLKAMTSHALPFLNTGQFMDCLLIDHEMAIQIQGIALNLWQTG
ncbi:MAG: enhanced serine sensitivity protein SseB C-terminal domain-containing protein [Elusimicrobia bacterium]|nr:enhanced serine sensitivity protein SseB C-terminal domain-containing protein [Elusimicrobiota bacterium]